MRMTLRQLSVFVAVAKQGTVTKASESVRLTQSAASMALSDLEGALESPLFDRVGKRLQLNDLGKYLLPQALEILARCEDFEQIARGQQQSIDLKVGATLTISDFLMPDLIADFLKDEPSSQINLTVGNTSSIIDAVNQFQLDVGFIEGSCHLPQLEVKPWHEDELCIAVAPDHPLAIKQAKLQKTGKKLTENDFADLTWVVRELGSGTREVFDNSVLKSFPNANIGLTVGHNQAVLRVVASGLGVCCISKLAVTPHMERGELVILETPFWTLTRSLYILTHKQKYQSPGLKQFLAFCKR